MKPEVGREFGCLGPNSGSGREHEEVGPISGVGGELGDVDPGTWHVHVREDGDM